MSIVRLFTRFQYARLPLRIGDPHRTLMEELEDALRHTPTAVAATKHIPPPTQPLCQTVQGIEAAFYLMNRPYQLNVFWRPGSGPDPTPLQIRSWVAENPLTRALLTCSLIEPTADALTPPHLSAPLPPPSGFWQRLPDIDYLEQTADGRIPAFGLLIH
jgi:hypothetical protein